MGVFFQRIMGASVLPVAIFTAIWGVVGVLLPVLVPRSPHKSVIQVTFNQGQNIFKLLAPGLPDHHRLLLLALLALLLHESDEPSDRSRPGDQGSLRDEDGVGGRIRLKLLLFYHSLIFVKV